LSQPTPRRTLGRQLADLRRAAKLLQDDVAGAIGITQGHVSKIENGKRRIDPDDVRRWAEHVVAQARQADTEVTAWKERFGAGWDTYQQSYAEIETAAVSIDAYQVSVIPGLLQTAGYTEFIQRTVVGQLDDQVEAGLAAMRARQRLLYRPTTRFSPILAEHVLRHRFPGAAVMVEQLRWLVQLAALPSVDLAVIPTDTDMPLPYMTSFDLLTMPGDEPDIATVETDTQEIRETDPDRVAVYARRHHQLRRYALTGAAAIERVQQIADELTTTLFAND
jgi:transcriptional regulator with XRE-family HTH domain